MRCRNLRQLWWISGVATAALLGGMYVTAQDNKAKDDPAVARTRKQVMMLDDLYKTAIVLVTENYVNKPSDLAAGAAFQKLFEAMRAKGHHDVRLLDATGEPYDDDNAPQDDFEKAAIAALKNGKPSYEQVVIKEGHRYLRLATPIPVVMKKCTLCHPIYEKATGSQPIGALSYTLPVE